MVSPGPVRILQVTDPHLFADARGELRGTVTHATFSAVVDDIRNKGWPADLVAVTGDIVQDDSAGAYERFREIIAPLELPVHCIPGNHDVRRLMQAALSTPPFHYCDAVRKNDWLIAGIDSCVEGGADGRVSHEELTRLETMLAATDADHVAVFLHHPPLPVGSRWLDEVGLGNAGDFLDIVTTAGNVRLVVFGHVHQAFDEMHGTVRIIGSPSTCAQFKPHSDTFAIDERPPGYRRISLCADGCIETDLLWLPAAP